MVEHRDIQVGPLRLHIAEEGDGPLVLLLHGFPECWYSWRHQFAPLAAAGFHVVAPDQRGYARSDHPADPAAYSILHLVGDVIGLIHALGEQHAVVIGHDWGAPVAWNAAQMRPDVITAVAGLSVPPAPRGTTPPLHAMRERYDGRFYWNYFEPHGPADTELARDPHETFRRILYGACGDNPHNNPPRQPLITPGRGFLDAIHPPTKPPNWLTEHDLTVFATEFADTGFTGGLNWYRNLDRNWELTAAWHNAPIRVPALHITGDRDLVRHFPGTTRLLTNLTRLHPRMREPVTLPGCGHWTQQERPDEVNALLLEFLDSLNTPEPATP
jgi:pimeloyl-ACP methyl ester carboxylesterase